MKKKYGLSLIVLLAVLILTLLFTGQVFAQPDPPALSSPAHGAFVEGPTVELEWEAPAGATHYLVWVYNLSTDQELYFEMVEGVTSFTVEDLPDNSDFIGWSVVAGDVDTQLWGDFAVPRIFQNGTDKDIKPPTLLSPDDGLNIPGTSVEFEWEAPVGAIAYNIAIINDTTGELLYFVTEAEDLLLETSFTFEGLPDNGDTILWTVFAASDVEWSDFAFPRTFVNGTAPDETFSEYEMSITGPEELLVGQAGEYDVRAWAVEPFGNTGYTAIYNYAVAGGTGTLEYYDEEAEDWIEIPLSGQFGPAVGFELDPDWDVTTLLRFTPDEAVSYEVAISLDALAPEAKELASVNYTVDVTAPIVPEVTEVDLQWSLDQNSWQAILGNLSDGYELELDPAVDFYYLDAADVTSNVLLKDGDYGFYVNPAQQDFGYWADKGVVDGASSWQALMWEIINGNEPIFYLRVSGAGTSFMLVDGLQKALGADGEHLRINGDYPLGTYDYTGKVTSVDDVESDDVVATITFVEDEEAVEAAALAAVVAGTEMTGDLEVGITATFPTEVPAFFDTAGYKINSEIVIAGNVAGVVTIAREGFDSLVFPDGLAAGTYTYTELVALAFGIPEPPAADFTNAIYGGQVEFYEITVSDNIEAIDTTVTVRSIISKDDFVTRVVLDELIDLPLVVEPEPPVNTLQAELESAPDYEYDPPYEYGDFVFSTDPNTFTGTYTAAEFEAGQPMNDMARYLGALYRQAGSTIVSIEYDGTVYTWNEAEPLVGSNWEDAGGVYPGQRDGG